MRLLVLLAVLATTQAFAWSDADEVRWRNLNLELRCLVCQNQSIADSHAPLAEDLRKQVRQMMEAGKTDQDIRLYMTQRYGDFVLYRPAFKTLNLLLWIGPGLMLLGGLGTLYWLRRKPAPTQAKLDRAEIQALLDGVERD